MTNDDEYKKFYMILYENIACLHSDLSYEEKAVTVVTLIRNQELRIASLEKQEIKQGE